MMTFVSGQRDFTFFVHNTPSMTGIRMSIKMTSTGSRSKKSSTSTPFLATPFTHKPSSHDKIISSELRIIS